MTTQIPKTLTARVNAWNRNRQKYNRDLMALGKVKRKDTKSYREKRDRLIRQKNKLLREQKEIEQMAKRHGLTIYGGK